MNIFEKLKVWGKRKEVRKNEDCKSEEFTFDDIAEEMRRRERMNDTDEKSNEEESEDETKSSFKESSGISYVRKFIEQAAGYENLAGSRGVPYTHKSSHGNCATLLWICNDCGFTSKFSVRNDLTCADEIFFCKKCRATQPLAPYYNGYKKVVCCICNSSDNLIKWDGESCPRCGGHIVQFNGIVDKPEFRYMYFNFLDKGMSLEEWLKSKDNKYVNRDIQ